jgi:hypothetical protein
VRHDVEVQNADVVLFLGGTEQSAAKIMAKDLVRTRSQITKFYQLKSHLQAVSLRMQVRLRSALHSCGLATVACCREALGSHALWRVHANRRCNRNRQCRTR